MSITTREVFNADQMTLTLPCSGLARVGFGISGTWVGTIKFQGSFDGVNFQSISVRPFASGTTIQSTTGNGNWEFDVKNFAAVRAIITYTSGSAIVMISGSVDASYQDAFLASTSLFVEQDAASGAGNTITIAAQANRAWRCRTVSGGFSVAPGAAVKCSISDGGSSTLWTEYLSAAAGGWQLHLPADGNQFATAGGGVVGTPGNSLQIILAAPGGSVASSISAQIVAA